MYPVSYLNSGDVVVIKRSHRAWEKRRKNYKGLVMADEVKRKTRRKKPPHVEA